MLKEGSGYGVRESCRSACPRWFRYRWQSPPVHTKSPSPVALLGDHVDEQCVGRDIERHAEQCVGAALVELA